LGDLALLACQTRLRTRQVSFHLRPFLLKGASIRLEPLLGVQLALVDALAVVDPALVATARQAYNTADEAALVGIGTGGTPGHTDG
jgi:hypothetical protein